MDVVRVNTGETGEESKICPILSIRDKDNITTCRRERCAWFINLNKECAIKNIAERLAQDR